MRVAPQLRALTEAAGSPVWPALAHALREAGIAPVATDIDPLAVGLHLGDLAAIVPKGFDDDYYTAAEQLIRQHQISLVIPSINEALPGWANRKEHFAKQGVTVLISPPTTIETFCDKWLTYLAFQKIGIPTPPTSLAPEYDLIKPRVGRGSDGIHRRGPEEAGALSGQVSQRYIEGPEYTVDVLCDLDGCPIYIVPRRRLKVESGISFRGRVVQESDIEHNVRRICDAMQFIGPINIQCIRGDDGLYFIEINPRIGGGLALSLAATTNWFSLIREMIDGRSVEAGPIRYGLTMLRYYSECFIELADDRAASSLI